MFIKRGINKEYLREHYYAIKKNSIMLSAAIWMELVIVKMREVSQAEKEKYHMILLICGILIKGTNELINKAEIEFSSVQSLSCVRLVATPWTVHDRPPCPSPTPEACSNSCPLIWWCHPTILSSVVPFSSCLQSVPASGSFSMSQF